MKLWLDDIRPNPEGYIWCKSVNQAKDYIIARERRLKRYAEAGVFQNLADILAIKIIDIDHDAGEYSNDGGDYIKLLDWFEATGRNYPIHIHSMNPIGVENMRRIIKRNHWKEI